MAPHERRSRDHHSQSRGRDTNPLTAVQPNDLDAQSFSDGETVVPVRSSIAPSPPPRCINIFDFPLTQLSEAEAPSLTHSAVDEDALAEEIRPHQGDSEDRGDPGDEAYNSPMADLNPNPTRRQGRPPNPPRLAFFSFDTYHSSHTPCCPRGDVLLPLPRTPAEMMSLWLWPDARGKDFRANARKCNYSVTFTSFKCTADQRITGGLKSFAIHGKVDHYQANLGTETALTLPRFCHLFDPVYTRQVRAIIEWTRGLNLSVVLLDMVLREKNPWVARYRHSKEMVTRLLQEREGEQYRVLYNPGLQLIAEAQSGIHK
ncbi:hypothetical protein GcM3_079024, partial [Golovinomyces cichoracearum]